MEGARRDGTGHEWVRAVVGDSIDIPPLDFASEPVTIPPLMLDLGQNPIERLGGVLAIPPMMPVSDTGVVTPPGSTSGPRPRLYQPRLPDPDIQTHLPKVIPKAVQRTAAPMPEALAKPPPPKPVLSPAPRPILSPSPLPAPPPPTPEPPAPVVQVAPSPPPVAAAPVIQAETRTAPAAVKPKVKPAAKPTHVDIIVTALRPNHSGSIEAIRIAFGLSTKRVRKVVQSLPACMARGVAVQAAHQMKKVLNDAGVEIELRATNAASALAEAESGWANHEVVLVERGRRFADVINIVREVTGLDLAQAKALCDQAPVVIASGLLPEAASDLAVRLGDAGARVQIKSG